MRWIRSDSARSFALVAAGLCAAFCQSCDTKKGDEPGSAPPPPPLPAAASSGGPSPCAGGGGQDPDSISAPFVPRMSGGFCLDPQSEPKTYGDQGKLSMDEVCTTAFDGECEVYKRFGLDRVVVLRYVDGSGAPSSVEVNLSRFKTVDGAYGMFTKRVIADGDPARASVKPLAAGAAAAMSSSNGYVWRGAYLVELTFVTEDAKMTPEGMARENERSTGAIAQAIGASLPSAPSLPPSAGWLPVGSRLPLGIAYYPKDAPALTGIGPVAVGYYKDGDRRWRDLAMASADSEAGKETFRAFKLKPGSFSIKGLGDEAVHVVIQEAADRPKAEYVVARKAGVVLAVGDEELVLDPSLPAEKLTSLKLTKDEKIQKLAAWLAAPAP
jgi:hypothetical protein